MDAHSGRIAGLCIVAVLWALLLAGADMVALAAIDELDGAPWAQVPLIVASFAAAIWLWWLPVSHAARRV
ncbi:MAG TPA: hypothetical protein VF930_05805 [Stellaceae bacterium]